jgi:hypothetical protein
VQYLSNLNILKPAEFEVLRAVSMKSSIFWEVMDDLCPSKFSDVWVIDLLPPESYLFFKILQARKKEAHLCLLLPSLAFYSVLDMEAIIPSETSMNFHRIALLHMQKILVFILKSSSRVTPCIQPFCLRNHFLRSKESLS